MNANDRFFESQEPPAVLKHGILKRYPVVFTSAAGQASGRVVLLDGYAGRGEYEDGTPGSPVLLLDAAAKTEDFRNTDCIFVERKPENFKVLERVVAEHGGEPPLCGDLSEHLQRILRRADGAALFAFLDPFGTALSYDELVTGIFGRPRQPPTEVLLHFSVGAIRRNAGLLRKRAGELSSSDEKTLARVNRFLGGDWWQQMALGMTDQPKVATRVAEAVAAEYCRRVESDVECMSLSFPVRAHPGTEPAYYLVLFTRHPYGLWRFNDSLSKAHVEWQEAWRGKANTKSQAKADRDRAQERELERARGVVTFFDAFPELEEPQPPPVEGLPPFDEASVASRWIAEVERNLEAMLRAGRSFRLVDHTKEVFGSLLGVARQTHAARAIKNLYERGISAHPGTGRHLERETLHPGPNATTIEHTRDPLGGG